MKQFRSIHLGPNNDLRKAEQIYKIVNQSLSEDSEKRDSYSG